MILLENADILNATTFKTINDSKISINITKEQEFKSVFTFSYFRWTGNSRKNNFKLSAHTLLNSVTNTTSSIDDVITSMKTVPFSDLLSFVKNSGQIPEGSGFNAADDLYQKVANEMTTINENLTNYNSTNLQDMMTNLFSNANSVKNTFANLFVANSKAAITKKIYVSSDTSALEVIKNFLSVSYTTFIDLY